MPKERKQRGRRKKKTDEALEETEAFQEPSIETQGQNHYDGSNEYNGHEDGGGSFEFFGLLDESEQNYFKTIDDAMVADEFTSVEDRDVFVENVYKEAEHKELKLATSPLGSKVLEQLLARSKPAQVKHLFKCFQGQFNSLVRHRYASHVCEMLFAIAATLVYSEMADMTAGPITASDDEPYVSTENLFLYMFNEISPDLAALGADIYASHVVRDLLLILNGNLFTFEEAKGQSKRYHGQKKFSWARPDRDLPVPASFKESLQSTMRQLIKIPAAQLRMTAAQPYSVSFIQALVSLESTLPDEKNDHTILFTLLGGESMTERDDYIESILREPSGSKLVETIVDAVPRDHLDAFYKTYFAGRAIRFALNPITNFVLQRLITKTAESGILGAIIEELSPAFKDLLNANHIQIIQRLVEASIRLNCNYNAIFDHIKTAFDCGSPEASNQLVMKILDTPMTATNGDADRPPRRRPAVQDEIIHNMQGAFLIKALLDLPEDLFSVVATSITEVPRETLITYAKSHAAIKVLESFLDNSQTTVIHRKLVLNAFFGHFVELSCDPCASRFVDLCWSATATIKLYKDRIAQELAEQAETVRSNYYGRLVWQNWNMDLYKNRRGEWNSMIKQQQAKKANMARFAIRDGAPVGGNTALQKKALSSMGDMNAARAVLIKDEGAKKARQKIKRQQMAGDEVDDIFNKRFKA